MVRRAPVRGSTMVKRRALARARSSSSMRPPWASAIVAHDRQAEPGAVRRSTPRGRSARRSAPGRRAAMPGPRVARPRSARRRPPASRAERDRVALGRVLHGVVRRGSSRPASAAGGPRAACPAPVCSSCQSRGASLRAFAISSSVSRSRSTSSSRRKSGRSALASVSRSSTKRLMRSSSSLTMLERLAAFLRVVAQQLQVAADDRDRRAQLVAGVARRTHAGSAKAYSSRSSIALNCPPSSAISSSPCDLDPAREIRRRLDRARRARRACAAAPGRARPRSRPRRSRAAGPRG